MTNEGHGPSADDRARLRRLGEALRGREGALIDRFYERMGADPAFAEHLPRGATLDRLRRVQRSYFAELLEARYDAAYAARRVAVGRAHQRVGLPQRLYTESYGIYLELLLEEAAVALAGDPELVPTLTALFTAVLRDIGLVHEAWEEAQAETERALREAREALEVSRRMDAVGRLAAGLAHDLNNVLGAVSDAAASLRASGAAPEGVDLVEAASSRASQMARRLLSLARTPEVATEPIDVLELLRRFVPFLRRMLDPGVTLSLELAAGAMHVVADPGELERVVMNLVLNARDAVGRPGRITLRAHPDELSVLDAAAAGLSAGPYLRIDLRDDGCGMSEDVRARIFEPLFTTKPGDSGTGLGLANVWSSVRSAGGIVRVESASGEGSTFTVLLPVASPPAVAVADRGATVLTGGRGEVVLLVEDDPLVGRASARLLRSAGYSVRRATSASAALEAAREGGLALVLTDCVLPDRSGVDLVFELRAMAPDLPVVMRTGLSPSHADPLGRLAGQVPILPKTIPAAELLAAVRRALDGSAGGTVRAAD